MKAPFFKILLAIFVCTFANANANEILSLKNHIGVGINHHMLKESVFQSHSKISELNWNSTIEPHISNELTLRLFCVNFILGVDTAIPVKTGFVDDRDWLFTDSNLLSNYSYHENFIDKDYTLYFKMSCNIPILFKRLLISPGLGVMYVNEKYTAKNGFYQYSSNENESVDSNTKKTNLCGAVMSYEASAFIPLCFLDTKIKINEKNFCFLNFDFFPYMFIDSIDTHIIRLIEFYDSMQGGYGCNLKTGYIYKITKKIELDVSASYSMLSISGISSSRKIGDYSSLEKDEDIQSRLKKSYWEIQIGFSYKMY